MGLQAPRASRANTFDVEAEHPPVETAGADDARTNGTFPDPEWTLHPSAENSAPGEPVAEPLTSEVAAPRSPDPGFVVATAGQSAGSTALAADDSRASDRDTLKRQLDEVWSLCGDLRSRFRAFEREEGGLAGEACPASCGSGTKARSAPGSAALPPGGGESQASRALKAPQSHSLCVPSGPPAASAAHTVGAGYGAAPAHASPAAGIVGATSAARLDSGACAARRRELGASADAEAGAGGARSSSHLATGPGALRGYPAPPPVVLRGGPAPSGTQPYLFASGSAPMGSRRSIGSREFAAAHSTPVVPGGACAGCASGPPSRLSLPASRPPVSCACGAPARSSHVFSHWLSPASTSATPAAAGAGCGAPSVSSTPSGAVGSTSPPTAGQAFSPPHAAPPLAAVTLGIPTSAAVQLNSRSVAVRPPNAPGRTGGGGLVASAPAAAAAVAGAPGPPASAGPSLTALAGAPAASAVATTAAATSRGGATVGAASQVASTSGVGT
eukprot:TRINITY_DN10551_c0_g1_i1.p1 TRINITY_DN10551_c0_g1~~TRINITY_DN10551_c0_g1_i1.p1  ORF type:complete len:547 (-),score=97.83 TRINITY_DN10551_c0_g1_i1:84-1586(-)